MGGSIAVATLRIHSVALTHEQVIQSFNADVRRFGVVALDTLDAQRCPWPAASQITNCDMIGYYDYHWNRGIAYHLQNCRTYQQAARRNKCMWGTWLSARPGKGGDERVNRSLWSVNIAMAFGCKTFLWFLGQDCVDPKTLTLKPDAEDFAAIHAEIMPLKDEIMKVGNPSAVYSTRITRDMFDKPVDGDAPAPGVPPFPAEFRIQPLSGEFIAGIFEEKPDSVTLFAANYNACAGQNVTLKPAKAMRASIFDRKQGKWQELEAQDGVVEFTLIPGGGELLRFDSDAGTALLDSLKTDADADK